MSRLIQQKQFGTIPIVQLIAKSIFQRIEMIGAVQPFIMERIGAAQRTEQNQNLVLLSLQAQPQLLDHLRLKAGEAQPHLSSRLKILLKVS